MAETLSNMLALGTQAPAFTLPDTVSDKLLSLKELQSDKATVIMFICNHCPFVKNVQKGLVELANDYTPRGVAFIAISSNDIESYPEDAPHLMKQVAETLGYPFPYLYDQSQTVAKAYNAACTPDFYIFDGKMELAYRGQLDDSRPSNNIPVTGTDVRNALESILKRQPVDPDQKPSIGCNIKWKS